MVDRSREVIWSTSASIALDEVVAYINESSPQNARLVLTAALKAAQSLSTFAERGRLVPEVADSSKRELMVLGYRLMYQVTEATVIILAFVRGRRAFTPGTDT